MFNDLKKKNNTQIFHFFLTSNTVLCIVLSCVRNWDRGVKQGGSGGCRAWNPPMAQVLGLARGRRPQRRRPCAGLGEHPSNNPPLPFLSPAGAKALVCDQCGAQFSKEDALETHRQTHTGTWPSPVFPFPPSAVASPRPEPLAQGRD